jgi:multidrug efflux system membrane fusion protein
MAKQGENALTAVRTRASTAQPHWRAVTARGHTEAKRKVMIMSEIKGRITKISLRKGSRVRRGDVLVHIDVADRDAHMAEAKALVRQRDVEYLAAQKLRKKGYRAETQYTAAAARLDAARAMVKQMDVALARTVIRAPFDAIIDSREVELGAYVKDGSGIALLVDEDPYLVVAQISEKDIGQLKNNAKGSAVLVTGQKVEGRIHYISATADEATRTYRVELLVPNPNGELRHGTTAELDFPTKQIQAHFITPAILTLDDQGTVGIRCVETGDKVAFYPVKIVGSSTDGVWVSGLPDAAELIVVGQEYVRRGDRVRISNGAEQGDGGKREPPKTAEASAS